jgi:hypothetical protein
MVGLLDAGRADPITAVAFSPDGALLATAVARTLAVWDATPLRAPGGGSAAVWCCGRYNQHAAAITGLSWEPDCGTPPAEGDAAARPPRLATASLDRTVRRWEVATPPSYGAGPNLVEALAAGAELPPSALRLLSRQPAVGLGEAAEEGAAVRWRFGLLARLARALARQV